MIMNLDGISFITFNIWFMLTFKPAQIRSRRGSMSEYHVHITFRRLLQSEGPLLGCWDREKVRRTLVLEDWNVLRDRTFHRGKSPNHE